MALRTSITLAVNVANKRLTASGVLGLRELVDVSLSPVASIPGEYGNWRLYLQKNGALVAQCLTFSAAGVGTLDLGTADLLALFAGKGPRARVRFLCVLWNEVDDVLIAEDWIYVLNNTAPTGDETMLPIGSLVAAEELDAFQVVRIDSDGKAAAVNPAITASVRASVGVTTSAAAAGASVAVQQQGPVADASWTWQAGSPVFLGADGGLTQVEPTNGPVLRVGVAQAATILWLTMWPGQNGEDGATGDAGEKGDTGAQGPQGPAGQNSTVPGPAGTDGATWHVTTAEPGAGLGSDGDLCFDKIDLTYFQKVGGAWVQIGSLAPYTDVIRDAVLAVIQSAFSDVAALTDPTVNDMVDAINTTINRLKGV